ncbi:secretion protein HlyD [Planctomycetota bacterium]|nr:secretion protein HlyD [Planctomycetota bacterium]
MAATTAILAFFTFLFLVGWLPKRNATAALVASSNAEILVPVRVAKPKPAPPTSSIRLPGNVEPARSTSIYSRTGGYAVKIPVDLGDTVTAGQILVELDVPDAAPQLAIAEAALAQRQAESSQAALKATHAAAARDRVAALGTGGASQQALDDRQAAVDAAAADLTVAKTRIVAAEAEVKRLQRILDEARITAPFPGVITSRTVEIGNLVAIGSGGKALFQLTQIDPLRIVVDVPQGQASALAKGQSATVSARAGNELPGTVERISGTLNPDNRTMRAEIALAKPGALRPGMYVNVSIAVPEGKPALVLPADALLLGPKGPQVAVVDGDDRIRLVPITIDSDLGAEIRISSGITAQDRVVVNPNNALENGMRIRVVTPPAKSATAAATTPGPTGSPGATTAATSSATAASPANQAAPAAPATPSKTAPSTSSATSVVSASTPAPAKTAETAARDPGPAPIGSPGASAAATVPAATPAPAKSTP